MDIPALLLIAGILVGLTLPGYALLRGLRLPPVVALGAAPAILAGVLTPLTVLLRGAPATGDGWMMTAWAVAGAVTIIGGILWWWAPARTSPDSRVLSWTVIAVVVLACAITADQMADGIGGLDVPLQRRDSVSHYNAIAGIFNEWGTVHPLETRGWMIGARGDVSYYPSTFHAIAAAIPVAYGVIAGNALAAVCVLIWIIGLTCLARVALPGYPGAWVATPLITLVTFSFPFIPFFRQGQWPYGMALALAPGVLALVLYSLRNRSLMGWLATGAGLVGIVGVHPSGVVVIGVMLGAVAFLEVTERAVFRSKQREWVPLPAAILILIVAVGVFVAASLSPSVIAMGSFPRPQTPSPELIVAMATFGHVSVTEAFPIAPAYGMLVLVILGLVLLFVYRPARPFAVSWLVFFAVLLLTPMTGLLADVSGAVWYGDPERILGVLTLFTTMAAALAVGWIGEQIAPHLNADRDVTRLGISTLVVVLAMSMTWMDRVNTRSNVLIRGNYHPSDTSPYFVGAPAWTEDDERFWSVAAAIVGNEGVMTDSASGGVLLPAMANIRAVPAVTTMESMLDHGVEAAWNLREMRPIEPDSAACVFFAENDIRWVYVDFADNTRFDGSHYRSDRLEPHGELALDDGTRQLWRIDACRN